MCSGVPIPASVAVAACADYPSLVVDEGLLEEVEAMSKLQFDKRKSTLTRRLRDLDLHVERLGTGALGLFCQVELDDKFYLVRAMMWPHLVRDFQPVVDGRGMFLGEMIGKTTEEVLVRPRELGLIFPDNKYFPTDSLRQALTDKISVACQEKLPLRVIVDHPSCGRGVFSRVMRRA